MQKNGDSKKVLWSEFAIESLSSIFRYYKERVGISVAQKIKTEILGATKQLKKHPLSGQLELQLLEMNEGHRYLVCGNYKIIYKEVAEGVLIPDVFDTRQDPVEIQKRKQ